MYTYVGAFLLCLKKEDGTDYEPDTVTSFHGDIQIHLKKNGYPCNILTWDHFYTSKEVLESKRKKLKRDLGKPNKAESTR